MKKKLSRIHTHHRRLTLTILINVAILIGKLTPRRARAHWIGGSRRRVRLERAFMVLLFVSAMTILEPHQFIAWAILCGGITSTVVLVNSIRIIIPRKQRFE